MGTILISINNFGEKRLHYVRSLVRINKLVLIKAADKYCL